MKEGMTIEDQLDKHNEILIDIKNTDISVEAHQTPIFLCSVPPFFKNFVK